MSSLLGRVLAAFAVIVVAGFLARPQGVGQGVVEAPSTIPTGEPTASSSPVAAEPTAAAVPTPSAMWTASPAMPVVDDSRIVVMPFDFEAMGPSAEPVVWSGFHGRYEVSPDGRWLALVTQEDGGLRLEVRPSDDLNGRPVLGLPVSPSLGELAFTPEEEAATAITWVQLPTEAAPEEFSVHYAPLAGEPGWATSLPPRFQPWAVEPLTGGRVAVYGHDTVPGQGSDRLIDARPQVMVLSAAGILFALDLPVHAEFSRPQDTADEGLAGADVVYLHGLAWDVKAERLYVAHADADFVTVVDLARGELLADITAARPSADVLAGMLEPGSAQAGGYHAGASRQALLSPDGARLFVSGYTLTIAADADGGRASEALPLLVFDTASGALLHRVEDSREVPLDFTSDGSGLLTVGGWWAEEAANVVRLRDTATLELRWEHVGEHVAAVALTPEDHVLVTHRRHGRTKDLSLLAGRTGNHRAGISRPGDVSVHPEAGLLLERPY